MSFVIHPEQTHEYVLNSYRPETIRREMEEIAAKIEDIQSALKPKDGKEPISAQRRNTLAQSMESLHQAAEKLKAREAGPKPTFFIAGMLARKFLSHQLKMEKISMANATDSDYMAILDFVRDGLAGWRGVMNADGTEFTPQMKDGRVVIESLDHLPALVIAELREAIQSINKLGPETLKN